MTRRPLFTSGEVPTTRLEIVPGPYPGTLDVESKSGAGEAINEWVCTCGALVPMEGSPGNPEGKLDACLACGAGPMLWTWHYASAGVIDYMARMLMNRETELKNEIVDRLKTFQEATVNLKRLFAQPRSVVDWLDSVELESSSFQRAWDLAKDVMPRTREEKERRAGIIVRAANHIEQLVPDLLRGNPITDHAGDIELAAKAHVRAAKALTDALIYYATHSFDTVVLNEEVKKQQGFASIDIDAVDQEISVALLGMALAEVRKQYPTIEEEKELEIFMHPDMYQRLLDAIKERGVEPLKKIPEEGHYLRVRGVTVKKNASMSASEVQVVRNEPEGSPQISIVANIKNVRFWVKSGEAR